jgi:hypothetical protein
MLPNRTPELNLRLGLSSIERVRKSDLTDYLSLFKRQERLLDAAEYVIKTEVPFAVFTTFVQLLKGQRIALTSANLAGVLALCDELGFNAAVEVEEDQDVFEDNWVEVPDGTTTETRFRPYHRVRRERRKTVETVVRQVPQKGPLAAAQRGLLRGLGGLGALAGGIATVLTLGQVEATKDLAVGGAEMVVADREELDWDPRYKETPRVSEEWVDVPEDGIEPYEVEVPKFKRVNNRKRSTRKVKRPERWVQFKARIEREGIRSGVEIGITRTGK